MNTIPDIKTGPWRLSDGYPELNGPTVFSCFHCGGGSTMGYKLAGCRVLGGVEIDPEMMRVYRANHHPKHSYLMDVRKFAELDNLPDELYKLDILDGSPPCSSFSASGLRHKTWGKEKVFREGQAAQRLDDLFFAFIAIAAKLRPKVVVAENVKGLIIGKAKGYVKEIFAAFREAGYDCQLFLLNASRMGVPQRRERTVFIARRMDIGLPPIAMEFHEPPILFRDIMCANPVGMLPLIPSLASMVPFVQIGDTSFEDACERKNGKRSFFNHSIVWPDKLLNTIPAQFILTTLMPDARTITPSETLKAQTFPLDYDISPMLSGGQPLNKVTYICGMSVPPYMMQRIALQIRHQWLG